ncbi:acylphosphatase [Corynebacterium pelargi]|uniref:acylphosphatase n=1 Tax=Corynebacterium pelargi TaxID=1471400 RepID=A0A410W824_9CORY|nr:acylphosphatase [Corynebacterium pelargi]QAU52100.1 Acylphosphatase [Corynebacterium pelargi]GGG70146.1 acylphosphatase [Corynebacterium pelargi]
MSARLTAWVHGQVQGVGFRWWTYSQAKELGLAGSATNLADGRVCVVAEGPQQACEELLERLSAQDPTRPGHVDSVIERWSEPKGVRGFSTQ